MMMVKQTIKLWLWIVLLGNLLSLISCQKPPELKLDNDLSIDVAGRYEGNYVVNYETHPDDNFSSQISLVVVPLENTTIRIDAQGGDSFECTITGSPKNLTMSDIRNTKGIYTLADNLVGAYINGRLYYKITGTSNGGEFTAEFTAI